MLLSAIRIEFVKQLVSNQRATERWPLGRLPLQIRSGRQFPVPTLAESIPDCGVIGNPVWKLARAVSSQPPRMPFTSAFVLLSHRFPLPNGSSYKLLNVTR